MSEPLIDEETAKEAMRTLIRFTEQTGMVGTHLGLHKDFSWSYSKDCQCNWCTEKLNNNLTITK